MAVKMTAKSNNVSKFTGPVEAQTLIDSVSKWKWFHTEDLSTPTGLYDGVDKDGVPKGHNFTCSLRNEHAGGNTFGSFLQVVDSPSGEGHTFLLNLNGGHSPNGQTVPLALKAACALPKADFQNVKNKFQFVIGLTTNNQNHEVVLNQLEQQSGIDFTNIVAGQYALPFGFNVSVSGLRFARNRKTGEWMTTGFDPATNKPIPNKERIPIYEFTDIEFSRATPMTGKVNADRTVSLAPAGTADFKSMLSTLGIPVTLDQIAENTKRLAEQAVINSSRSETPAPSAAPATGTPKLGIMDYHAALLAAGLKPTMKESLELWKTTHSIADIVGLAQAELSFADIAASAPKA